MLQNQAAPGRGGDGPTHRLQSSKGFRTLMNAPRSLGSNNPAGQRPLPAKLLELETQVIYIDLGCCQTRNGCSQTATPNGCEKFITPQNSPQSMRVWPGLRLIGAGGKIPSGRGGSGAGRSEAGQWHAAEELLRATQPSHAVTYASSGPYPPQPRLSGFGALPPHAAPPVRGP